MALLLSHWHCIVPLAAILIALFFMNRDKSEKKGGSESAHTLEAKTDDKKEDKPVHE